MVSVDRDTGWLLAVMAAYVLVLFMLDSMV